MRSKHAVSINRGSTGEALPIFEALRGALRLCPLWLADEPHFPLWRRLNSDFASDTQRPPRRQRLCRISLVETTKTTFTFKSGLGKRYLNLVPEFLAPGLGGRGRLNCSDKWFCAPSHPPALFKPRRLSCHYLFIHNSGFRV